MKQKLMDNDLLFRKLIENSYSGIVLFDAAFIVIYCSPSVERIIGRKVKKRAKTSVLDLILPQDWQHVELLLQQVLQTPSTSQTCTFRSKHFDGREIWLQCTFTNRLNEPDTKAIVCDFIDISTQKQVELQLEKQAEGLGKLLDMMTDGFISLDENLCYTYANKPVLKMLGKTADELIGQYIWTIFPDVVGSATYRAIETAFKEKKYVHNEDFYAPLQLWHENRIYPSAGGIFIFIRDITRQKKEEHRLKLLESVIINTAEAVLITEAEPFDEPGPRILYVNEAFTRMTGYTAEEVIGKTPRILHGPKTDREELNRISQSLRRGKPFETTLINYKKNGDEFWLNSTLSPVADEKGLFTHWISIERDITLRKNEELQQTLLSEISLIFNESIELNLLLDKLLKRLVEYGHFDIAEVWLIGTDKNKVNLVAKYDETAKMQTFYQESDHVKSFMKGEGLPGSAWESQTIQLWDKLDERGDFARRNAAKKAGIKMAYGIPLISDNVTIGILLLGAAHDGKTEKLFAKLFELLSTHLGADIKRKQLEQELNQIFNFAPDIICIVGVDKYFKKINPALCNLLEYTEDELLTTPITDFIHPDDYDTFENLADGTSSFYFENRFITRSGKIKWLGWTSTLGSEDDLLFCVGKDITDKKELEVLLNKVTNLAQIGGWEFDLIKRSLYWSKKTKEIYEVSQDFEPDLEAGINFYKEGESRNYISKQFKAAIEDGLAFDFELEIVTAKGNIKWVRVIGEPECIDGRCVRIYGSIQDVDARVKAEIKANDALEEGNIILESIGDAFFAVDKNWVVNYWNNMAEKVLARSKAEMLDNNLWEVFSDSVGSESYIKYNLAIETNKAVHFEDYYPPLDKWYEVSAYPSDNGLSVYFKDITERKISEMLLIESEKKYSELFQLSPLPNWVYDPESLKFLDVNQAAINHYGYTRDEFLAMTIKEIRPAEDIPVLEKILSGHEIQVNYVLRNVVNHQKKNGEKIQVDIQSNNILYKGKSARIVIANDVTERLNYIKAVEEQNEKLREISWLQSHVVRAPLAKVLGLAQLINSEDESIDDIKRITEYLLLSANELDGVIGSITDKTAIVNLKKA